MMLSVGQSASFSKTITEHDVYSFAGITGDFNPVHINNVEAENSVFGKPIAHGMLVGSLISTVLGTLLPGQGTVYLEQDLKFLKPVYFGDTCTAFVKIDKVINKNKGIYRLDTYVENQNNEIVCRGFAVVKY